MTTQERSSEGMSTTPYRFEVATTPVAKIIVMRVLAPPGDDWWAAMRRAVGLRVKVWLAGDGDMSDPREFASHPRMVQQ